MPDGTREQLILVHLSIENVDLGVWDSWNGAEKDTDNVQYRSGGDPVRENLGGGNFYTDLTIGRNYRLSRDRAIEAFLDKWTGIGKVVAQRTMLDRAYRAYGDPVVISGQLNTFSTPNGDSNGNNPAMIQVVVGVNSVSS